MSFKLLAIRPLEGCNEDFLKNLEVNRIYKFYSDYKFYNNDIELSENKKLNVTHIKYESTTTFPKNLYDDFIDISAIVGKNGSGKSALVQLLCGGIYNLSIMKKFIKVKDIKKEKIDRLKVQIFYSFKNRTINKKLLEDFYVLEINGDVISLNEDSNGKFNYKKNDYNYLSKLIPFLFYNIVNNYSIYGLNATEVGSWINKIFIKNDGYRTPIVLNPYREDGNIDVNLETFFAKNRLLSNLLNLNFDRLGLKKNSSINPKKFNDLFNKDKVVSNSNYLENKKVVKLELSLNFEKFKDKQGNVNLKYLEYAKKYLHHVFNILYISNEEKRDYTKNDLIRLLSNSTIVEQYVLNYIFYKLEKISPFINDNLNEKNFLSYLKNLNDNFSDSHVLFKVYQAINFLKYDIYKDFKNDNNFEINVNDHSEESISNKISILMEYEREKFRDKYSGNHIIIYPSLLVTNIAFLPPPIFNIDIVFSENQGKLSDLSSGEKQIIYSIQGILYHLINISSKNSFRSNVENSYQFINIILDEVELYFHPDMQRKFVFSLINAIKGTYLQGIQGINVLFITHSPFILSDIPKQNVLFLEVDEISKKAKPNLYEGYNTFGANIHEMLTNGFFLGSTKGEFAISKINEFLSYYKKVSNLKIGTSEYNDDKKIFEDEKKDYYEKLISIIGEDYIRKILENHLEQLYNHFEIINEISKEDLFERKKALIVEIEEIDKKLTKNEKDKL
ncbi:hypothetical protein SAMN05443543_107107 [Flavobacterium flevense]|uniref:ATPase AAA-type core domain-containing protein n=1 Tax=Flavobacterium flevense TaxID=983 RepID=A0A4Y4AUX6_9FLAO|nr:hypothetical protein [Flavobacterium flevense]GEC72028.1 hypothetical protein FFL01_15670 [Flavobacterium flevense]SHL93354.1 hypothetical protein SAMN05443543_107107 [Flavobacterium flevense]